ncbi:anti-sigma factor antagonist [Kitasatospora sp. NBC_00240]|nr:anti-sigma factor antagonist [Kitasatospora sp. NBC_00240]
MSSPAAFPAARLRAPRPDRLSDPKVWRTEVLAGLVVALALIPEAISFSIIAGVDPRIGLFASFTMAVTISVVGGRRAMISAATGAVALVIGPLNREHGFGHLVAAVILAGVFQIVLGALGVAKLMCFVPRSVTVGFVNSLAILIFMAQVPERTHVPWAVHPLVAAGLALMVFFPKVTRVVPAPLVSIVVLTVITLAAGIAVPTVGDKGALPSSLPVPGLPDVPFTLETLTTVAPYALAMALVGLMESLMTAELVDDITGIRSNKARESIGQGIAIRAAPTPTGRGLGRDRGRTSGPRRGPQARRGPPVRPADGRARGCAAVCSLGAPPHNGHVHNMRLGEQPMTTTEPVLAVTARTTPAGAVLEVAGELDHDGAPRLAAAVRRVLAGRPAPSTLDLDLAAVTFCDSSGLTTLLRARSEAGHQGTVVRLAGLSRPVARLLEITGIDRVFAVDAEVSVGLPQVRVGWPDALPT